METEARFAGKVAVVTGAASGVGRVTALRFAREGAEVLGLDINEAGLAETAAAAEDSVTTRTVDITSRDQCHAAIAAAVGQYGAVDVLANVAGVSLSHHIADVTEEQWRLTMGVNVDGMFWLSQAAIPHLLERDGCIVNVASNAGLMGQAYTVPYCASKGAVIQLTKAMAMEFAKTGLRVNAVAPGGMVTPMTEQYQIPDGIDFELMTPYVGYRGMGTPDDAAAAICWIASEEARRCHGSILSIDGGLTAS